MAAKKRTVTHELLLNTVARKLGHAAGTLTKVTQELADNVSAVPESVAAKVRQAARAAKIGESNGKSRAGESNESARSRIRHAGKKLSRAVRPTQNWNRRGRCRHKETVATAEAASAQSKSQQAEEIAAANRFALFPPRSRSARRLIFRGTCSVQSSGYCPRSYPELCFE